MITGNNIRIQASKFPIKSVKISKQQNAEVVRTFPLKLQEGQNTLKIEGLPSSINFARPSGLSATARLDDFTFTGAAFGQVLPAKFATSLESVRILEVKLAALHSERSIKELESQLMLEYGKSLSGAYVAPAEMSKFLESFSAHSLKTIEEVTALNEKIVETQREIDAEKAALALKAGTTDGFVTAMITADSDIDTIFTLTYMVRTCEWTPFYELHAAMENGKPSSSISLHYLAEIKQSTGEDWGGAEIILSTTENNFTPILLPRAPPLKIQPKISPLTRTLFGQSVEHAPPTYGLLGAGRGSVGSNGNTVPATGASLFGGRGGFGTTLTSTFSQPSGAHASAFGSTGAVFGASAGCSNAPSTTQAFGVTNAPLPPLGLSAGGQPNSTDSTQELHGLFSQFRLSTAVGQPDFGGPQANPSSNSLVGEVTSVVHESPLSVFFNVKGKSCIPSDGLKHRVSLVVLLLESHVSYVTIPREDPTVFLQCAVKNTSDYRLLSGPVSIIVDEAYISTAMMENDICPGGKFECTLGADVSTKVTYTRTTKSVFTVASSFAEATDTTVYNTKITVANKHAFDIADLVVRDRMPACDDPRVRVLLRQPSEICDIKDGAYVALADDGLKVGWEKLSDGKEGEKEGKFEWQWNVKSGQSVELKAEYEIKVPKGTSWVIHQ